jgi:acyl dehydratase
MELKPYRVNAYNLARNSENKMHDDTVARKFGFSGGLVPGVDVFAYMSHMPVAKWGRTFLERGAMDGRFLKPVYDGAVAEVTAQEVDGALNIQLVSNGVLCATARASLSSNTRSLDLNDFDSVQPVLERVPADERVYAVGKWLGIPPYRQGNNALGEYLRDIREGDPIYQRDRIVHPGTLLRTMNWALMENAILGPWIHVGSTIRHVSVAKAIDELTVRAKVIANYERKGHRFVELDGVVVANDTAPICHCRHVAIYQPRTKDVAAE